MDYRLATAARTPCGPCYRTGFASTAAAVGSADSAAESIANNFAVLLPDSKTGWIALRPDSQIGLIVFPIDSNCEQPALDQFAVAACCRDTDLQHTHY